MERLSSASFPPRSIVALISAFLGVILHLNGFGLMFNPSLLAISIPANLKLGRRLTYSQICRLVSLFQLRQALSEC